LFINGNTTAGDFFSNGSVTVSGTGLIDQISATQPLSPHQLNPNEVMDNVSFANSLVITQDYKFKGLLLIQGDSIISGNISLDDTV